MSAAIEIIDVGLATTLQDRGRPGLAHLGVPASGMVDPGLAAILNRLVGNPEGDTVIETCGGLGIRAVNHLLVASSTEPSPRSLLPGESCIVPAGGGDRLWQYLAVRGGIVAEQVLGSCSYDTLSELGPAPLSAGLQLAVGPEPDNPVVADLAPLPAVPDTVCITPGPRADWFTSDWQRIMTETVWTVSTSSRVGVRMAGGALERESAAELPSEGLVRGAIQVPPDGNPVMMLCDHPTTGGYPVIAVVDPDDVAIVAQHGAGRALRFRIAG